MILDPTDQNIRDQGFNFVPFDRYLARVVFPDDSGPTIEILFIF